MPTQPRPIAQPSANMRSVGMPMTAAASRFLGSCLKCEPGLGPADEPPQYDERGETYDSRHELRLADEYPAISFARPTSGSWIVRNQASRRTVRRERMAMARPKVAHICASIGAFRI